MKLFQYLNFREWTSCQAFTPLVRAMNLITAGQLCYDNVLDLHVLATYSQTIYRMLEVKTIRDAAFKRSF